MQNNKKHPKQQQQQQPPPAECGLFRRVGALLEKYHLKVGCIKVKHSAAGDGNPKQKKDDRDYKKNNSSNTNTKQCHQGRSRSGSVCLSSPLL